MQRKHPLAQLDASRGFLRCACVRLKSSGVESAKDRKQLRARLNGNGPPRFLCGGLRGILVLWLLRVRAGEGEQKHTRTYPREARPRIVLNH
jgi:hypothetical protein